MLIDFHTHAFPQKIAERAISKLAYNSGGLIPFTNGTVESLKERMKKDGVTKSVVLNIATNEKQMTKVNDFAEAINGGDIVSFGSIHPDSQNVFEELERIKAMGLKGVKLHPDYQGFFVDDEKMFPIYKKISSLCLITVFHAGQDIGFPPPYHAEPAAMLTALKQFDSPVVAAHFGGMGCKQDVLKYLCGTDIFLDTSFAYGTFPKYYAAEIIKRHGSDKILFGTDCPWHSAEMELSLLDSLELTQSDYENIKYKNAQRLLCE